MIRTFIAASLAALLASCGSSGEPNPGASGATGSASPPTKLEILAPRSGDTIKLPAEVRYRVQGLERGYLRVSLKGVAEARPVEIPFEGSEGAVLLPDDKAAFFVGHRDLLFRLETEEGKLVPGSFVIRGLTIEGRRGA